MYDYSTYYSDQAQNAVLETTPALTATPLIVAYNEPVTIEEAAQFCKIEVTDDNNILTNMITAARQECEDFTGIGFARYDRITTLKNEIGGIRIPFSPVHSITAVYDANGVEIEAGCYVITGETIKRVISPQASFLKIVYNSGYDVLPMKFKQQVLNQILYLYQNRGDAEKDNYSSLSPQVKAALTKYRTIV